MQEVAPDSKGLGFIPNVRADAGRTDVVAWLDPLGQTPPEHPVDRLLAAYAPADEATARAWLADQPDLISRLAPELLALLPEHAQRGAAASVQLILPWAGRWTCPGYDTPVH